MKYLARFIHSRRQTRRLNAADIYVRRSVLALLKPQALDPSLTMYKKGLSSGLARGVMEGFIIFAFFLVLVTPLTLFTQDFSADIIHTSAIGSRKGKIFVSKDKARMDMPESIIITRADTKNTIILLPGQKTYIEQPFDPGSLVGLGTEGGGISGKELLDKENIDGNLVDKYVITYEFLGQQQVLFQWVDPSSEKPVRTAAEDGSWLIEYKNVTKGKVDPALFEIPAGYKKFALQGSIMENLSKAMSSAGGQ